MPEIGDVKNSSNRRLRQQPSASTALFISSLIFAASCGFATRAFAADLTTVTIAKAVDTIPFTVVDVAIEEGFFKQNGIEAKVVLVDGSTAASAAMVAGSVQFACEAANPLMLGRSKGVPILSVDALDDALALQLVVSKQWLAKHPIPANATLEQKMADLNDSTFASISTTDQTFFEILRSWAGLPKETGYRRENLGSEAADVIAMQKGIVDAAFHSPPASVQMVEQGYAELLVDRRDVPGFNNIAYDLLTTTSAYADQHPAVTTAVATAIAEAVNFLREHPEEALAIEQKHFQKLDKVVLQKSLEFVSFAKNGMQSQKAWDSAVSLAQQTGSIQGVTNAPEGVYWTNKYIDVAKLGK